jgi:hypothetical protein
MALTLSPHPDDSTNAVGARKRRQRLNDRSSLLATIGAFCCCAEGPAPEMSVIQG